MAAALILAPRIAKLGADKASQKVEEEKRYCAKLEMALAEAFQRTTDYLLVAATAKVATKMVSVDVLGRVISEQLKHELSNACTNVKDALSGLMAHFVLVLREHSLAVSAITEWLLDQARAVTGTERQAVCIAGITGISAYHHTSLAGESLWDIATFQLLAPEILKIDDSSFLLAMFRRLLGSKSS
ncbi:hypothetical protein GGI21_005386, partial [Coemansia aciculifera]